MGRVKTAAPRHLRIGLAGLTVALALTTGLIARPLLATAAASGTDAAATDQLTQPVIGQTWAGYDAIAATTPAASAKSYFTSVSGSFAAPTLRCDGTAPARASVWVGLGGVLSTRAVYGPLQVGIDADCSHGRATYSAWYETYPEPLQHLRLAVTAGDELTAAVSIDAGGHPHFSLLDGTTAKTVARALEGVRVKPLATDSAEWIVEGPARGEALADFGNVAFTGAAATESLATASHTGGIDDAAWDYSEPDVIAAAAGGVHQSDVLASAAPGPLGPGGSGFTVSYGAGAAFTQ